MIVYIWMYGDGTRWLMPVDTDNPPEWLGGTFTVKGKEDDKG